MIFKLNKQQFETIYAGLVAGASYEDSYADVWPQKSPEHKKAKRQAEKIRQVRVELVRQRGTAIAKDV